MKIILLFMFAFMACSVNAQTISANEMIEKTKCTSFECFNDFIITKGFSYFEVPEIKTPNIYTYLADRFEEIENSPVKTRNSAVIELKKNNSAVVSFRTSDKAYYQKLLAGFKKKGFKSKNTLRTDNGVATEYASKNYPKLILVVLVDVSSKEGQRWTSYDFSVSRK